MTTLDMIVNNVLDAMSTSLEEDQLEKLQDVLYIQFHGYQVTEGCTDIVPTGISGNEMKVKMFIASKRIQNLSPATLQQYARQINNMLDFLQKPVEDITPMDLRYYFGTLREERNLAAVTVRNYMKYISSFYDFLVSEGLVNQNPVKQIGQVKVEKTIKKPFTSEELESIRLACNNPRDRALIEFLYSTGVRVSELVSLNVGNVSFSNEELIVLGKGQKERKTYLTDNARFYLCRYLETRKDEPHLMDNPLFVSLNAPHNRLTTSGVRKILKRIGEKAGVPDCHPHRFRRTLATDLLNRGMGIEQVQKLLGHEKLDTTMIYCDVSEEGVKNLHHRYA